VVLLQRGLERDSLSHAYLFVGPAHVGKMTLALNLAQALNCEEKERPCGNCDSCRKIMAGNHSDVQVVRLFKDEKSAEGKSKTEIGIEQIKELQHAASLPPFEGKYKIFIVEGAEFLSSEAANRLLKTLEEPVGKVVFVLLTGNDRRLFPTVVSRCQRIELMPMPAEEIEVALVSRRQVEPERAKLLARLSHGCLGWAMAAAEDGGLVQQRDEKLDRLLDAVGTDLEGRFAYAGQLAGQFSQNREAVQGVLDMWLDWWRDLMLVKVGNGEMAKNIDHAKELNDMAGKYQLAQIRKYINSLQEAGEQLRLNANPRLVLEVLMLDMPEKEARSEGKLTTRT
jgi:DNA polymerase-3 subunit delta'